MGDDYERKAREIWGRQAGYYEQETWIRMLDRLDVIEAAISDRLLESAPTPAKAGLAGDRRGKVEWPAVTSQDGHVYTVSNPVHGRAPAAPPASVEPAQSVLPAGLYRVIAGELVRIEHGLPAVLPGAPPASVEADRVSGRMPTAVEAHYGAVAATSPDWLDVANRILADRQIAYDGELTARRFAGLMAEFAAPRAALGGRPAEAYDPNRRSFEERNHYRELAMAAPSRAGQGERESTAIETRLDALELAVTGLGGWRTTEWGINGCTQLKIHDSPPHLRGENHNDHPSIDHKSGPEPRSQGDGSGRVQEDRGARRGGQGPTEAGRDAELLDSPASGPAGGGGQPDDGRLGRGERGALERVREKMRAHGNAPGATYQEVRTSDIAMGFIDRELAALPAEPPREAEAELLAAAKAARRFEGTARRHVVEETDTVEWCIFEKGEDPADQAAWFCDVEDGDRVRLTVEVLERLVAIHSAESRGDGDSGGRR